MSEIRTCHLLWIGFSMFGQPKWLWMIQQQAYLVPDLGNMMLAWCHTHHFYDYAIFLFLYYKNIFSQLQESKNVDGSTNSIYSCCFHSKFFSWRLMIYFILVRKGLLQFSTLMIAFCATFHQSKKTLILLHFIIF